MSTDYLAPTTRATQPPVTAQVDLSFDEVANLFPLPIAEAAATLGVSTNDLKRVCRANGLNRWPHRKVLAGKTVEDIKKEAAREMAIQERMGRSQSQQNSNAVCANKPVDSNFGTPDTEHGMPNLAKQNPAGQTQGLYGHAPALKSLRIDQRTHVNNQFPYRINVPTYLDELRHGFPNTGLHSLSMKWWGSADVKEKADNELTTDVNTETSPNQSNAGSREEVSDKANLTGTSEHGDEKDSLPSSMLARTRKSSTENGRKAISLGVTRGYGEYRLGEKDEALLRALFCNSIPSRWKAFLGTSY